MHRLAFDPRDYLRLHDDELAAWIHQHPSPIVFLNVEAQPLVFSLTDDFSGADHLRRLMRESLEPSVGGASAPRICDAQDRADEVQCNLAFHIRLMAAIAQNASKILYIHLKQRICSDVIASRANFEVGRKMHDAFSLERHELLMEFRDARLASYADRWIHQDHPDCLAPAICKRLDKWVQERILGGSECPWRTIEQACVELESIAESAQSEHGQRLLEIDNYLSEIKAAALRRGQ